MYSTYRVPVHVKPGLFVDARILEVLGALVMVLGDALFVVLPAVADVPGLGDFVQAAPWVASAPFWMPRALFGHSVGWGNVRESTEVYARLKFETNADQFCTLAFLFGFAASTSVLMDALIMAAVFVMRSLLLFTLSVIHVE